MGNQHAFEDRLQDNPGRAPVQGFAGKWPRGDDWDTIAFLPHRLDDLLKEKGFEPEEITRLWRDRGWLEVAEDGKRRTQKKVRINGGPTWAIVIRRQAYHEVMEG
jgi:hypothetical protein